MLPYTLHEAIKEIGKECSEQKILDLIISGQLEACFRYDGIIGIMNEFIPIIHNDMDSSMLKNEILKTVLFNGWLKIENQTKGFHELLYRKLTSIKITNSLGEHSLMEKSKQYSFALLDEDIESYELFQDTIYPKIYKYCLTFDDLRISGESFKSYIDNQQKKEDINSSLLNEIEDLKEVIKSLKSDLIKGKSIKSCNQLIYALLDYANLDVSHPHTAYRLLANHCDAQKQKIPIPEDDASANYFKNALYEFNNRDPK